MIYQSEEDLNNFDHYFLVLIQNRVLFILLIILKLTTFLIVYMEFMELEFFLLKMAFFIYLCFAHF